MSGTDKDDSDVALPRFSNRRQVALFVILTLLLTGITVAIGRVWFRQSETLVFAAGNANSIEGRFATKLAAMLKANGSRIRVKVSNNPDNDKAVAQFDRRQADLAILRTDHKIPARARAVAILDHDILVLMGPPDKKKSSGGVVGKKIAVVGDTASDDGANIAFVRKSLNLPEASADANKIQIAPANVALDKLFDNGFGAVALVMHGSRLINDKAVTQFARQRGGLKIIAVDHADMIARKNPDIFDEKVVTGLLSTAPMVPDDDIDTVGLQWLLVGHSRISETIGTELGRLIYENKSDLALEDGFASRIESADTDKGAFVVALPGVSEYLNDEAKSFMDRYSDLLYVGAAALSVIGSIFAAIYTRLTRIAPEKAGELATAMLDVGEKVEHANSAEALAALQDELEAILRRAIIGLKDGTISSDGLDTFRLGYDFVRDGIDMRRESLKRVIAIAEDKIVVVKTLQG